MVTQQCDHQRIDDFLAQACEGEDALLLEHLSSCASCQAYFDQHTASEDQWARARKMLQPSRFDAATISSFSAGGLLEDGYSNSGAIREILEGLAPSDDPDRMGRIDGYEVSGVVGVGGMGVVLKAIDPALDRVVAIKVLSPHLSGNDKARKRFSREARAAAAVLHPNVIPIYSVSKGDSLPHLVMAYARGGSLQKRIDEEGALSELEVLRIGSQIASGLAAAHGQGLVHRDIKPENIMLEGEVDRVAITDFGLARAVDDNSVTQAGAIAGTPMYMSPEQARGESIDPKSDLFSLGSVLYALCTGQPPYRADTSYSVMRKIIEESPTAIRELNPSLPDWLASIVEKLMARDKSDRFDSAEQVHILLEGCLNHVQQPDNVSLPAGLPQQSKRGVKKMATLMTLSLLVIALGSYAFGLVGGLIDYEPGTRSVLASAGKDDSGQESSSTKEETKVEVNNKRDGKNAPAEETGRKAAQEDTENTGTKKEAQVPRNNADPKEQQLADFNADFRWMLETSPELRQQMAAQAMARGDEERAKQILAMVPIKDPLAEPKIKLAELLEKNGKHDKAVDAYLEAYRRDPQLVDYRHFRYFKNVDRMSDLSDMMTEEFLGRMGRTYQSVHLLKELLEEQKNRKAGFELLNRIWKAQPYYRSSLLSTLSDTDWKEVKSPERFARPMLIPIDVASEGKGWKRFTIESTNPSTGSGGSGLLEVRPILLRESVSAKLALEVEDAIGKNPEWQAGLGLAAVLQARAGRFDEAIVHAKELLRGKDAIPSDSAWVFGQALAGIHPELDQEAIRLYEHCLDTRNREHRILRTSPIGELGVLYARKGDRETARRLLYKLAYNKEVEKFLTRYPPNEKFYNIQAAAIRFNYLKMPVDSLLLLGQVDSGMQSIKGGSQRWVVNNFLHPFNKLKKEAEEALTPGALMEAWDTGVFFVDAGQASNVDSPRIDLRLNVNSLNREKSRLDSAVLQVFQACCKQVATSANQSEVQDEMNQLDDRITGLLSEDSENLECAILAAAFSLYRQQWDESRTRLQNVQRIVSKPEFRRKNRPKAALWPIAREALLYPNTRGIGKSLGDLAFAAVRQGPEDWTKAIASERGK
ncbi:MAG: protein kinase [Planctomycetota bacterium]